MLRIISRHAVGNFDLRSISDLSSAGCKLFFSGLGGDQALTNLGGNISVDLLHNFYLKQYIVWNGGLRKSFNGGNNWDNIKPVSYEGGWVTPYEIHPNNPLLIVA